MRNYLPALKNFPAEYIYAPWTAPEEVQIKAGCIVGRDYPEPMVDHAKVNARNMQWMRDAYANADKLGTPTHRTRKSTTNG